MANAVSLQDVLHEVLQHLCAYVCVSNLQLMESGEVDTTKFLCSTGGCSMWLTHIMMLTPLSLLCRMLNKF